MNRTLPIPQMKMGSLQGRPNRTRQQSTLCAVPIQPPPPLFFEAVKSESSQGSQGGRATVRVPSAHGHELLTSDASPTETNRVPKIATVKKIAKSFSAVRGFFWQGAFHSAKRMVVEGVAK